MRFATMRGGERGSFMLGFAGLIVLLAVLCGSVLFQSLQAYRSSAFHLWRLQARAAAEGAAVALARSSAETTQPLVLGDAVVTPGAPSSGGAMAAGEGAATGEGVTTGEVMTTGEATTTGEAAISGEVMTTGSQAVLLAVEVRRGGRAVYRENYSARFDGAGESTAGLAARRLVALEVVR